MARADWSTTAQALAEQFEDDDDNNNNNLLPVTEPRRSISPIWSRRSNTEASQPSASRPRTVRARWLQSAQGLHRRGLRVWSHIPLLQKVAIAIIAIITLILGILALVFSKPLFAWLGGVAKKWRDFPAGWLILWALTFFVSFPPMIGYSSLVTIAGIVFGMKGWFIMASATVIGSTASFVVSRTLLKSCVSRMTEKNKKFAALSLVLKHDGLKLLCMIRLCPLPYSLANGAISTIPTVTWPNFMLATAIASPKLLLHIFVGSRIGDLAEHQDKMDTKTQIVSWVSIVVGISLGILTGYVIYVRTKARAKVLEAEEAAAAATSGRRSHDPDADYEDDSDEQAAVDVLRRTDEDISLHTTYADEELEREAVYRDEFTDDEDAQERNVFEIGDGDDDDDTTTTTKKDER